MSDAPILGVAGLSRRYGGVVAVSDVSFDVRKGSITALIGPISLARVCGARKSSCSISPMNACA